MAARAIWAGALKIGSTSLPVKLYSAVQDQSIHFHILESKTKTPVKQHMVNPDTGEEVASEDIQIVGMSTPDSCCLTEVLNKKESGRKEGRVMVRNIPLLSKAGMPSRSEGWGGLFRDEQYRLIRSASRHL